MDQVINFDKTFQIRLDEYEKVFFGGKRFPYAKLQGEWAFHLELTVEPNGWRAIWDIPRSQCEELKLPFPTIVLVYVIQVHHSDLSSLVRILAVQDENIDLPDKHIVPLIQLWVTKGQDESIALKLDSTANALDMLRFFYLNLVRPWDEDEDCADWKGEHLIARLKLFYDMRKGNIPKRAVEQIFTLINEAKALSCEKEHLVNLCASLCLDYEDNVEHENVQRLIAVTVRLAQNQHELTLLENETFRSVMLKSGEYGNFPPMIEGKPLVWLVTEASTARNHIKLFESIKEQYQNEQIAFAPSFTEKLLSANSGDTILLSPHQHKFNHKRYLLENLTIKGIGTAQVVCVPLLANTTSFDFHGKKSVIENITIDCRKGNCAVLIRTGHVSLKNCKIIGKNSSAKTQGIVVLNGAKLSLIACDLSAFSTGIVGNSGSELEITDSLISKCQSGIKAFEECQINIQNTIIKDCEEFGIIIQTDEDFGFDQNSEHSFEKLNAIPEITAKLVSGSNNRSGDLSVKPFNSKAIEDLFENPDLDPTIMEDADES
ncbi:protein nessun dorma [Dendroctonus ponderosae]|nr:protein nessun dorma [Dendroctonus ponderosae]KAH1000725.1 hypothetical protein HUJ04_013020 [Dendroctonus ponderosae]KAH1006726.1 hypothetical protein HUJ05_007434 [Dendroctonus ponderosae]